MIIRRQLYRVLGKLMMQCLYFSVVMSKNISESQTTHGSKKFRKQLPCQQLKDFYKPAKKPDLQVEYVVEQSLYSMNERDKGNIALVDKALVLSRLDLSDIGAIKQLVKTK